MSGLNADLQITTLTNGLVLIMERKPWMEGAYCHAHLRLGSCDEDYEKDKNLFDQGLCHLLEHTLFRGSKDYGEDEISRRTVGIGGSIDASTDRHVTSYCGWSPSGGLPTMLDAIDSMIFRSNINLKALEEERAAVIGEVELRDADPLAHARDRSLALLYPDHKIRFPVQGVVDYLADIRATRIREIIRGHHKPQNAVLCLSGSIPDEIEIEDMVYEHARGFSHRTRAANSEEVARNHGDPTPIWGQMNETETIGYGTGFASVLSLPVPRETDDWDKVFAIVQGVLTGGMLDAAFGSIPGLMSYGVIPENLIDLSVLSIYVTGEFSRKTLEQVRVAMQSLAKRMSGGKVQDVHLEEAKVRVAGRLAQEKNQPSPLVIGMRQTLGSWWTPSFEDVPALERIEKKKVAGMLKGMFGGESSVLCEAIQESI